MSGHGNGHHYQQLPPNAELVEYVDDGDEVYGDVIPVDEAQIYYEDGDEIVDVEDVEIVEGELDGVEGETIYEAPDGTRHLVIQQRALPRHVQQHHVAGHEDELEPEDAQEEPQQHSRYRYHTAPQMPRPISGDEYTRSPRINSVPVYKATPVASQPTTSAAAHPTTSNHVYAIRNGQVFKIDKKTGHACAVRAQIKPASSSISNQENQVTYSPAVGTQQSQAHASHQPQLDYRKYGANPALTYFAHEQQRSFANAKHAKKAIGSKKPCNCSKSQCLKLYCECFASGEFCMDCNCKDCHNNMDYESERTRAVKATLERNPHAFRPKIGIGKKGPVDIERLHRRGCHCKKSNCLKNYCECYEAKVPCTERCKCCGCRNTEAERAYRDNYRMKASPGLIGLAAAGSMEPRSTSPFSEEECDELPTPKKPLDPKALKGCPWYYLNDEVIEATTTCLLTAVARMEPHNPHDREVEEAVLNEFSLSLGKVVESAMASITIDDEKFIDQLHSDRLRHTQPKLVMEQQEQMDLDEERPPAEQQ
uniref:CRC domain-containing protein n=1 Tax=Steinernema glaseri TaxID=37863 RepID=A0A1I7XX70_9BILA